MRTLDAEFKRIREDIDSRLDGQPSAAGAKFFCFDFDFCRSYHAALTRKRPNPEPQPKAGPSKIQKRTTTQ